MLGVNATYTVHTKEVLFNVLQCILVYKLVSVCEKKKLR